MNLLLAISLLAALVAVLALRRTGWRLPARLAAAALLIATLALSFAYLVANTLTGNGIDASVLFHLMAGMEGAAYSDFIPQIAAGSALILVTLAAATVFYWRLGQKGERPRRVTLLLGTVALITSAAASPGGIDIVRLAMTFQPATDTAPADFVTVMQIHPAAKPKNFIVLFLEQGEQVYLNQTEFPGLMPNLTRLAQEGTDFRNIDQVSGTSWSIAGMTSAFCGIPLVGAGASNSMGGMDRFMPRATCLGDLLAPQGYRLEHIIGSDLDFAGWGKFFSDHGFQRVEGFAALDATLPKDTPLSPWGLHDETLLSIAVDRIKALEAGDRPFGFVLNTLDTHHPSGHPGPACAKVPYQDGSSSLLDSYHCLDHLVGDFVAKLKAAGVFRNTVLIVSSDHLSMPNDVYDRLKKHVRHDFVMAYGAGVPPAVNDAKGSTLDTGVTLLNLIGYDVPALGLGRDLLPNASPGPGHIPDIEAAIHGSVGYLTSLWAFPDLEAPMIADADAGKLELGKRSVSLPALFLFDDRNSVQAVYFDFYDDTQLSTRISQLGTGQRFLWIDHCPTVATLFSGLAGAAKDLCAVYGRHDTADLQGVRISGRQELDLPMLKSALDWRPETVAPGARMLMAVETAAPGTAASRPPTLAPASPSVEIVSAGFGAGTSFVSLNGSGDKLVLRRGLSVVGLSAAGTPTLIDHADTCAYETPQDALPPLDFSLARIIHDNQANFAALAVVAADSADCGRYELGPIFDGTDLARGRNIAFRSPYIALIKPDGAITEMTGAPESAIHIETGGQVQSVLQR